jgi:hypothetical protein
VIDLSALAQQLRDSASLVSSLAGLTDEVRHTLPRGYHPPRSQDGITRPVEDIIVALETRGVTSALSSAHHHMVNSLREAETAALLLNRALTRWENAE